LDRPGPSRCINLRSDGRFGHDRINGVRIIEDEQLCFHAALAGCHGHLRTKLSQHALGTVQVGELGVLPLDNHRHEVGHLQAPWL
jgi:hypothetical protein